MDRGVHTSSPSIQDDVGQSYHNYNCSTNTGYDGTGVLRWQRAPDGQLMVWQVDGLGRPTATIANYSDGLVSAADAPDQDVTSRTVYDAAGRAVETIGPDDRRTRLRYDLLDRLIAVQENAQDGACVRPPCNVVTQYGSDRAGNRTGITDANGHTRRFGYDAAGRQTSATDALGQTTTTHYDAASRMTDVRDPRGADDSRTYRYDGLDRLHTIQAANLDGGQPITMRYDALGRRVELIDGTGTTRFTPDALGRITRVDAPTTGTVGYAYDGRGLRTGLTYPNGLEIKYAYGPDGQLEAVRDGPTSLATYDYDAAGRLDRVTRANGATTRYGYDRVGQVRDIHTTVDGATTSRFVYTLDRAGQRTGVTETLGSATRTIAYGYDGLQRLTDAAESPGTTYGYRYDLAGNRTETWVNGTRTAQHAYTAANQVVGWTYARRVISPATAAQRMRMMRSDG
jgi:YD repeat-containing protein